MLVGKLWTMRVIYWTDSESSGADSPESSVPNTGLSTSCCYATAIIVYRKAHVTYLLQC